jgi:hypothetical protein
MADFWWPRFSPLGDYLAAGSALLQVAPVGGTPLALGTVVVVGAGIYPTWISNTRVVFHNRLDGGAARICQADAPTFVKTNIDEVARPSNRFVGGGGVWVNYAAGSPLTTSTGLSLPNRSWPAINTAGRFVHTNLSQTEASASDTGVLAQSQPITDLAVSLQGVAWSNISPGQFRRTFGVRAGSAAVEQLSIVATHEYLPVVVDTPAGPWLLIQTPTQLLLHPWGNATSVLVFAGELNFPHAVYHTPTARFLVAGSQNGNLFLFGVPVNVLDPIYTVGTGGSAPGSGGTASPTPTPTQKLRDAAKLAAARRPRAVYPHLKQIKDADAQAATRILYDRIFQVEQLIAGAGGVNQQIAAVQAEQAQRAAAVQTQIEQLTVAGTGTSVAVGGAFPTPTPPGGGGTDPGDPGGGIANQLAVVEAARLTYDAFTGVERAGRIVNQVAWDLRNMGVGVLRKTSGTNFMGWSIDVIMVSPSAATYDILHDAEGTADPIWTRTSETGFGDIEDWQAPIDPTSF